MTKKLRQAIKVSQFQSLTYDFLYINNIYVSDIDNTINFTAYVPIYNPETRKPIGSTKIEFFIHTLKTPEGNGIIINDDNDVEKIGVYYEGNTIMFFNFEDAIIENNKFINSDKVNCYAKCIWDREEEDIIIEVVSESGKELVFPEDL